MGFFRRTSIKDEPAEGADQARVRRRLRVLVVDEDDVARSVLARRLSHLHYDVIIAENGFAALNSLVVRPVDAILIDAAMTMLPGIATMKKIRAAGLAERACFILIGGHHDKLLAVQALEAGADDYIVKPFDFDVLDARLRHLCARAEHMNALTRYNAELDARIARRALELGETREALHELQADRTRLVSSIQALHDQIERLSAHRT